MPPAPVAASASPTSAIGDFLAGGSAGQGADQVRAQLEQAAAQIGDAGAILDGIVTTFPNVAQEVTQAKMLMKRIILKAAEQAPQATASSQAVPTGASMGPQ